MTMKPSLRWSFAVTLLVAGLLWIQPSFALRCGTSVISEGDHQPRVLELCGEPSHAESWQEERVFKYYYTPYDAGNRYAPDPKPEREPAYVKEFVTVERWTYNLGSHRLVRYLIFENGVLVRITTGEHGY